MILCRSADSAIVPLSDNGITSGYYTSTTARPRASYSPISGSNHDYRSNRPAHSSAGLQSLDTYPNRRQPISYYRAPVAGYRSPIRILETPYDPSVAGSSSSGYRSAISRGDSADFPPYDGVHTTANGFQYYLRKHYHEEERGSDGSNVGSFGYVDPFGIRRVIYYKTDPLTGGFLHRKNNRYVGLNATPYDPLPPESISRRSRATRTSQTSS